MGIHSLGGENMIKAVKVRLLPTKEQEILMFKSTGVARFAYNWGLATWEEMYKQNQKPSKAKIRKLFNNDIKKQDQFKWLYEVSGQITAQAFIDLGVSDLATISCLENPIKNINKTKKVRKLKKRLKRLQRQVSRKYEANKDGNKFVKTKNIIKLEKQIKLLYRKLSNIRDNHIHQTTASIIKLKPYRVVMEDLNVSGMMKNKHLSKAIQEQKFYEFIRQMKYKCEFNEIEFVQADRFYPSSKTCSCCGNIKKNLKLKDRVYKCEKCNLIIDRDKNASINLGNYKIV